MQILIVEDDTTIATGLEYSLQGEGFSTVLCQNVASGRRAIETTDFDLCLLDITLPDGTGYELCRQIREKGNCPVIFLTALEEEVNVVMGLDMGADDYITKPFRLRELISRIHSVLRRYQKPQEDLKRYKIGQIRVNKQEAKVYKNDQEVALTALEYRLLLTFIQNEGQVLSRAQLLEGIWDVAGDFVNDNTLTVYIKRLRDKLEEEPQKPQIIKTIRGLGYKLGD
ncbi:response regulator transcription factor [Marinilactibacillus psychrotolerans]|uniref:Response regulator transcription factor n=1 Tax=Marinilactibacillus psychrotolerans TaxID=191770 RepID=A0AAV3WS41_9LACT|nr:response regulator transcription factor [Marinilactibacillus psychrotolerans]GEL65851.1 DNA-binding response regulator [Marinilactibacillus psychrotolerans]GEQ34873.1 two-component system response regulator [Marinilactibacillus psychrotolerans]SDC06845.1 DNA-binding response regulator, OmpR family, contains REC and winged-helix (wHTH) domain [Marinilactibacillus psychrotolerans]